MSDVALSDSSAERPVFVDASGRRRRTVRRVAVALTSAIAAAVGILVVILLGAPIVPTALLPVPQVDTTTPATDNPAAPPVVNRAANPATPRRIGQTHTTTANPTNTGATTGSTTVPVTTSQAVKPEHGRPTSLPTPPGHSR